MAMELRVEQGLSRRSALEPNSLDEALRLAEMAVKSRLYNVQSAEAALMILLTGRDLGMSASQSLRGIYVVSNKPVVSADALIAAVKQSGYCESWSTVETTVERCTIETKRKGEKRSEIETWTMEDARRAGLAHKDVWKNYPRTMLRHRTAAELARRVYPDVCLGIYVQGEMRDDDQVASRLSVPVEVVVEQQEAQAPAAAKESVPPINLGALEQAPTTLDKLSDQLKSAETLDAVCTVWTEHSTDIGEEDTGPDGESRGIAAKARKLVNARVVELGLAKSATAADKAVKARCLVLTQPKTQAPIEQQPTPAVGEESVQQDYERSLRNCETLNEIAKLWIDKRTVLKTLGEEVFASFWEKTVSRADDFRATRAALKAAIKTLEGPPDGPGSKKSDAAVPASAQGTAAPAAASDAPQAGLYLVPNDESAPYVASADEWRAHVAAYKHRENAINSWKKHCAAFRSAGDKLYRDRLQTAAERFQALANAVDVEVCKVALLNAEREANNNARKHAEALMRKAG